LRNAPSGFALDQGACGGKQRPADSVRRFNGRLREISMATSIVPSWPNADGPMRSSAIAG